MPASTATVAAVIHASAVPTSADTSQVPSTASAPAAHAGRKSGLRVLAAVHAAPATNTTSGSASPITLGGTAVRSPNHVASQATTGNGASTAIVGAIRGRSLDRTAWINDDRAQNASA